MTMVVAQQLMLVVDLLLLLLMVAVEDLQMFDSVMVNQLELVHVLEEDVY